jgi:hypothetical protein
MNILSKIIAPFVELPELVDRQLPFAEICWSSTKFVAVLPFVDVDKR